MTQKLPERFIDNHAIKGIAALLMRHAFGNKLMLVSDDATWNAAGIAVRDQLPAHSTLTHHSLGVHVHASMANAEAIINAAKGMEGLIAVGSGTINDLTKYAAAKLNKPYIAVATAASINGYTSTTASLETHGIKSSHIAQPPRAVVADISVIAAAPTRLARAGLGDVLCRSTVEVDMILSHHLFGTPYPEELFAALSRHEQQLLAQAEGLHEQRPRAISALMRALLDGGDAMTQHGSSAVASQGEHMIAHTAEMLYGSELSGIYHGEMIALTTLTMGRLQERMLKIMPTVNPLPRDKSLFTKLFDEHSAEALHSQYQTKSLSTETAQAINEKLKTAWPEIKRAIHRVRLDHKMLERVFTYIGVPTQPKDINLDPAHYTNAIARAYLTRDRFTFLDLAAMNNTRAA